MVGIGVPELGAFFEPDLWITSLLADFFALEPLLGVAVVGELATAMPLEAVPEVVVGVAVVPEVVVGVEDTGTSVVVKSETAIFRSLRLVKNQWIAKPVPTSRRIRNRTQTNQRVELACTCVAGVSLIDSVSLSQAVSIGK